MTKIHCIQVIPVQVPIEKRVRIRDSYGFKRDSSYNIIILQDSDGREGLGEATFTGVWSGETQKGSKDAIEKYLFPAIKGIETWNMTTIQQKMDEVLYGHPSSKAAIEMAIFDLIGKERELPLYKILGGKVKESVPIKFSISGEDTSKAIDIVRFAIDHRIDTVKIKIGTGFQQDVERVRAIHNEFSNEIKIALDANNALDINEAKRIIVALEDIDLLFFEQPVSRENFEGMCELRNFTSIPIIIDEGVFTPEQAFQSLKLGAADIYSVYPGKNGGINKTMTILEMVKTVRKRALLGSNLELGIASAAMCHIGVSNLVIDDELFPSDIIGPLYHRTDIITTPLDYQQGRVHIPKGNGLGVEIDKEKLKRFQVN